MKHVITFDRTLVFSFIVIAIAVFGVSSARAQDIHSKEPFEVAAWIPYWKIGEGSLAALEHIDTITTLHPFAYGVEYEGTLSDLAKIEIGDAWEDIFDAAEDEDIAVIPTIIWSDAQNIHRILSDKNLREEHIEEIDSMVSKNRFDGVVIDYENKLALTRDSFSLFLEELKDELGTRKELICAVEARTPPASLYRVIPATLEYANDYTEIGRHCDKVIIMAYDQGRADWMLNSAKFGSPYIPVADVDWVRKVAELAAQSIPKEKIILGAPTYGFEYEVTVSPNWFQSYRKLWSVSAPYAKQTAETLGITPLRNKAGELSFSYAGATTPAAVATYSAPVGTPAGDLFAQKALAYANATGQTITFNLQWWSDAEAIAAKTALAKELDLAGIALFRIDGTEDPEVWNVLP